jgi:hypothetical protein
MRPTYKDGDVVEFRLLRDGRDKLEEGKCYYVQRDDRATFKMLVEIGEEELIFAPMNTKKFKEVFPVERREISRMALAVAKVQLL